MPDSFGFRRINDQPPLANVISQRRHASHPHALALGGSDLVPDALARDLAFELGERQQDIERSRPIEVVVLNCLVTATNEIPCASNSSTILAEVGQRAGQAIHLVDDYDIDEAFTDIGE